MRGLYAIIDVDFLAARAVPLVRFAERVVAGRPAAVQLRAKSAGRAETLEWLRILRSLCDAASVPLFANDRPDLAALARCDGVHVGQDDLDIRDVRRFAPSLEVGVSTHLVAELRDALTERPDYVAFGPVFATTSKRDADPVVGLDGLRQAADSCRGTGIPLVAIGGIDMERAALVRDHAPLGAVIRALLPDNGLDGVTNRVVELHRALGGI